MIDQYNINQFKFDGTGNADSVFPGSAFDSDFDAAIHLIERLRKQKPAIFINLTTGAQQPLRSGFFTPTLSGAAAKITTSQG
jgi:hypothetical protein